MNSLNSSELLTFCASFDENETSYFFFLFLMYYLGFVIQLYHESELFSFKYTYPSDSRHLTDTKTVKLSLCRCQHILQCSIYHHLSVAKTATVKRSPDRNWRRSRSQHAADMQQLCIVVMMVVLVSEYRHHLSHSVTCQCCWVLWMTLWSPVFSFSQPSRPLPLFKIPPFLIPATAYALFTLDTAGRQLRNNPRNETHHLHPPSTSTNLDSTATLPSATTTSLACPTLTHTHGHHLPLYSSPLTPFLSNSYPCTLPYLSRTTPPCPCLFCSNNRFPILYIIFVTIFLFSYIMLIFHFFTP